eukprot:gene33068-40002_t
MICPELPPDNGVIFSRVKNATQVEQIDSDDGDFIAVLSHKYKSGRMPLELLEDGRPHTAANSEAFSSRGSSWVDSDLTSTCLLPMIPTENADANTTAVIVPCVDRPSDVSEISWGESHGAPRKKMNYKGFAQIFHAPSFLNAVCFAPCSFPKVLSAATDGKVYVYDVASGDPLVPLTGHTDRVLSLAVSPVITYRAQHSNTSPTSEGEEMITTSLVVSGSRDEHMRIWDLASSACLVCIHAAKSPIWAVDVAVGPHGEVWVVTGSGDGKLRSWNGRTGKKVASYRGHMRRVTVVRIFQAGEVPLLVSGGEDQAVRVWELLTGKLLKILQGHTAEIVCLHVGRFVGSSALGGPSSVQKVGVEDCLSGLTIFSAGKDASIKVWDYYTSSMLFELKGHSKSVQQLAMVNMPKSEKNEGDIAANTPILISCGEDKTVRFWNLLTRKMIKQKKWHSAEVSGVDGMVVSNAEDRKRVLVASCGWDKTLQIHDLEEVLSESSMLSCTPS